MVNRCYFLLKINDIDFTFPFNNDNNEIYDKMPLIVIHEVIENEKNGNTMSNNYNDMVYIYKDDKKNKNNESKIYSLVEPLKKYIKKEAEKNNLDGEELEKKIFGKIFWLSSEKDKYKIPYIKDENFFSLEKSEERIPPELFKINYILKTLGISIKLVKLNFLLGFNKNIQTNLEDSDELNLNTKNLNTTLGNFYYNKNFANWRPQGRLMTTVYDHQRPIEKLIPMKNKKFCSFDSECTPIIWKIKGSDDEFILKKKWSMNLKDKYSLSYKKTINFLDNLFFIFGSEKSLYSINFISVPATLDKLCDSPDDSLITCTYTIGNSILESQKILFTTENGSINIYDPRVNGISLTNNLKNSTGIPYCISEFNNSNSFYLVGTLSGKMLIYDLRINTVINEFNYHKGSPILGMNLLKYNKDSNKSLLIWSGNEDFEIGLWNVDENYIISENCKLLLKVNSIDEKDKSTQEPLIIDKPQIKKVKKDIKNKNIINDRKLIIKNYKNLNKFSYKYDTRSYKNLIYSKIKDELYLSCRKTLNNLCNIYDNPNTVQSVLSPLCGDVDNYENSSYLLSGGNDRTIRYWDINRDINNEYKATNSYIINTPTNMTNCIYE
jgi:hypothetical protein